VTFIIAAIVDPEGDRSIETRRDCFEFGSGRLILASPRVDRAELEGGTDAADDAACRCFADFAIEILQSVPGGVAPHDRSPIAAIKPAGQDL
jgi:hypothetical protein